MDLLDNDSVRILKVFGLQLNMSWKCIPVCDLGRKLLHERVQVHLDESIQASCYCGLSAGSLLLLPLKYTRFQKKWSY